MKLITTKIEGVFLIKNFFAEDNRGSFTKIFNRDQFIDNGLNVDWQENYYSVSAKDTIRGMHFQLPPHDHEKLVSVSHGSILDVVLDLRPDSKSFGEFVTAELNATNRDSLYIPKGCAHGFLSLEDNTITNYQVATCYNASADSGVNYNSFGFDWPVKDPIVSDRDCSLIAFNEMKNIEWRS